MATAWEQFVDLILNGEAVEASITNRPTSALSRRTQYLYDRLQAMAAGEALFAHDVPIESAAVVGDVVYYDDDAAEYKRALAAVELDEQFGWYTISKSSYAIGIVYSKSDVDIGSICTAGTLRSFDLSNTIVVGDETTAGPYYLSMQQAGKLTNQKPPVGIYVLYNRGDDTVHVMPVPKDMLEDHIHHKHTLYAQPAGEADCVSYDSGEVHQVVNPDSSLPGWLPADDSIFNGLAPEGAKFGYNLSQHDELLRVWPPQPLDSGHIEVNRGNGFQGLRLDGTCPDVIINAQGIWWMNNCYGSAPWPPDYPCDSSSSASSESSDSCDPECQTPLEYRPGNLDPTRMSLTLWFTKMVYKTDASVVTSLQPDDENSPIIITDCDGEEASRGDLFAGFDATKLAVVEPVAGYNVVKSLGSNSIRRGPAVTGLKAGTGAAIVGIGTENVDWSESGGVYRGNLEVGLEDTLNDPRDYAPNLVAVNNVREEFDNVSQLFYLHYPANRPSDCRHRVEIPRVGMPTDPIRMYLWFWFVGRAAGAIPSLTATYRRYPLATATPVALPSTDTDIVGGGWTPGLTLAAGQYAYAATPWFTVVVGDTVFFTIGWDGVPGPSDGFGIMRIGARVEIAP
jgi:hypothetical protein